MNEQAYACDHIPLRYIAHRLLAKGGYRRPLDPPTKLAAFASLVKKQKHSTVDVVAKVKAVTLTAELDKFNTKANTSTKAKTKPKKPSDYV